MYLAWSMTYFHINLDPRGKKKKVLPPILIPVILMEVFFFSFFFWLLFSFVYCFVFILPILSKDTSSGRNLGRFFDRGRGFFPGSAFVGQQNHIFRLLPACTVGSFFVRFCFFLLLLLKCSVLNTPAHFSLSNVITAAHIRKSVWVCVPREHTRTL